MTLALAVELPLEKFIPSNAIEKDLFSFMGKNLDELIKRYNHILWVIENENIPNVHIQTLYTNNIRKNPHFKKIPALDHTYMSASIEYLYRKLEVKALTRNELLALLPETEDTDTAITTPSQIIPTAPISRVQAITRTASAVKATLGELKPGQTESK